MACNCHKPCNQSVCCSECVVRDTCKERCPACTDKQEKEEPKSQKED